MSEQVSFDLEEEIRQFPDTFSEELKVLMELFKDQIESFIKTIVKPK